jgi:hypothetical protein
MHTELTLAECVNDLCPMSGRPVDPTALARYRGQVIGFASKALRDQFMGAFVAVEAAIRGRVELAETRERELSYDQSVELARRARVDRWLATRTPSRDAIDSFEAFVRPADRVQRSGAPLRTGAASGRHLPDKLAGTCH